MHRDTSAKRNTCSAAEYGCVSCGLDITHESEWLWLSAERVARNCRVKRRLEQSAGIPTNRRTICRNAKHVEQRCPARQPTARNARIPTKMQATCPEDKCWLPWFLPLSLFGSSTLVALTLKSRQASRMSMSKSQAGLVSASYLQAKDEASYQSWKWTEQQDRDDTGVPH